jgi:hypothetical protein
MLPGVRGSCNIPRFLPTRCSQLSEGVASWYEIGNLASMCSLVVQSPPLLHCLYRAALGGSVGKAKKCNENEGSGHVSI